MTKVILILFSLIFVTSCASYIESLNRELEKGDQKKLSNTSEDQFDIYRKKKQTNNYPTSVAPSINRQYSDSSQTIPQAPARRVTSRDLNDNGGDGSLWSGDTSNVNHLFSRNVVKRTGDIILIQVLDDLKREITLELRREFPDTPAPIVQPSVNPVTGATSPEPQAAAPTPAATNDESNDRVYDKISSLVVEEISNEHILVRGRKEILFRGKKRMIELEALVPRREISDTSTVDSDKFLETRISVVK